MKKAAAMNLVLLVENQDGAVPFLMDNDNSDILPQRNCYRYMELTKLLQQ